MGTTHLDPAALQTAARRIDTAADIVFGAIHDRLDGLTFDAAAAGRAHANGGGAVRAAVDRTTAEATQWANAARELAATMRIGADRYVAAELAAALTLR